MRLIAALLGVLVLVACPAPPKGPDPAALEASAEATIQAIPAPDPARYHDVHSALKWLNPYVVITRDGVDLVDYKNNELHHLKPEELVLALGKLPPAAWPYGRVVATSESSARAPGDDALIRKNRGIVAGTLEGLHVLINWFPPE